MDIAWDDMTRAQQKIVVGALCASLKRFVHLTPAQAWRALSEASPVVVWHGERSFHIAAESKPVLSLTLSSYLTDD